MTTAPTITLSEDDLTLIRRVHGHLCPMVLLGARVAKRAAREVTAAGSADLPFGFFRGHGCAVDGIQLFSGCTLGNANLVLLRGRNFSFLLTLEEASEGVLVAPLPALLDTLRGERTAEGRKALLDLFPSAPDEDLFHVSRVEGIGSLTAFPGD